MSRKVSNEVTHRLRWHAGLDRATAMTVPSIDDCARPNGRSDRLDEALADFLATLAQLNHELNGEVPSASTGPGEEIPRDVAYAVAEVISILRDANGESAARPGAASFAQSAWLIEIAWLAVLAGDIDELQQHVDGESAARGKTFHAR
jgi:hypothetical protein